jgi:hypothetical protein
LYRPFFDFSACLAYNIDKKRGKKRGERKTRKRTNGDKKDRQAATTKNLENRIAALLDTNGPECHGSPGYTRYSSKHYPRKERDRNDGKNKWMQRGPEK